MYVMANTFSKLISNLNNAYIAVLMTSPMLVLEVFLMGFMYENKRAIRIITVEPIVAFALSFSLGNDCNSRP